jgi:hypothetical protein
MYHSNDNFREEKQTWLTEEKNIHINYGFEWLKE